MKKECSFCAKPEVTSGRHAALFSLVALHVNKFLADSETVRQAKLRRMFFKESAKGLFLKSALKARGAEHIYAKRENMKNAGNIGFAYCIRSSGSSILRLASFTQHTKGNISVVPRWFVVSQPVEPYLLVPSVVNGYLRNGCSEFMILSHLQAIQDITIDEIYLFTEMFPCDSCSNVIAEFLSKNCYVKRINLFYEFPWHFRSSEGVAKDKRTARRMMREASGRLAFFKLHQHKI